MGSKFLYSSTYHPQKNGKIEVVIISLGNSLRSLIGENRHQWDMILAQGEFANNDSVNRSIGKSPFYIVYGRSPKDVVDLIKFSNLGERKSVDVSDFVEIIQEMHEQVKHRLEQNNAKHKKRVDFHIL